MDFNNLQFLTKVCNVVQTLAVILVFFGAILQGSRFYLDKKINDLKEKKFSQLESKIKNRVIDTRIFSILKDKLSKYSGEEIWIASNISDSESQSFSNQLKDLFQSAGWVVQSYFTPRIYNQPVKGLLFIANDGSRTDKLDYLLPLFNSVGFASSGGINKEQHEALKLLVGDKN